MVLLYVCWGETTLCWKVLHWRQRYISLERWCFRWPLHLCPRTKSFWELFRLNQCDTVSSQCLILLWVSNFEAVDVHSAISPSPCMQTCRLTWSFWPQFTKNSPYRTRNVLIQNYTILRERLGKPQSIFMEIQHNVPCVAD